MLDDEAGVRRLPQQPVELVQLAALALPAHPAPLLRVPAPLAVEEEEAVGAVPRVQPVDALAGDVQQRLVAGEDLLVGVAEIGEQREVQVPVAVGEEADLEVVEERVDLRSPAHQRRHGHDGPVARGDALAHVELRQLARRDERGHEQVEQVDDQLAHRQHRDGGDQPQPGAGRTVVGRVREQAGHRNGDGDANRAQVAKRRMAEDEAAHPFAHRRRIAELGLELEAAARDEVVADVMLAVVIRRRAHGGVRQPDRPPRDIPFRQMGAARQLLD